LYLAGFCLILTEQTGLDSKYTLYEKKWGPREGRELSELNIIHDHGNLNFFLFLLEGKLVYTWGQ